FVARFRNGYYFMTSGTGIRTGIFAGAGQNAWGSISDSTKKERLLPMNHADVLRKIGGMKLSSWNYKGQRDIRHYGPMAQDFYAAFGHDGLGQIGCDTLIYSHDFAGVTFAGVQALIRENEQLHVETQDLASQVRRLREETQDLSSQVRRLHVETQDLASLQARTNQRLELLEQAMLGRKRVVRATPRTRTYSR
ncbi:MAG: tail fiber domain-containing protein, partial [Rudanella sp.]|nr:tail fiber domain-containing protein [Rudanella sp.]